MSTTDEVFPVDEALPELSRALHSGVNAVLIAPPGAGKTTRVPPALLDEPWCSGRVIVLEPRRIAARSAARFVAAGMNSEPGGIAGYRVRMESRAGPQTRIEYVTEGIFSRMILDDPELSGISAVLFDEYHERSLEADLGLALALDAQAALRTDLRIVVMSATLEGTAVAALLGGAPVIESRGRAYPVKTVYRERKPDQPVETAIAMAVRAALSEHEGSVLAFLPGQREILRTRDMLEERLPANTELHCLYGAMEGREQDAAIRPPPAGKRKVVLSTAIAETSITIDGVRIVIDSGLERVPKFEPATGLTRLETGRASLASVDQRAGRAGRTAPGTAIRLWREQQNSALRAARTAQIREADLTGLVLDLAEWGVTDPMALHWLDSPPAPAWKEAVAKMRATGAIDNAGGLTTLGRQMRKLPFAPALSAMVVRAGQYGQAYDAALLALLVSERGLGGSGVDLAGRLANVRRDNSARAKAARGVATSIARQFAASTAKNCSAGALLSLAFGDRIARRREAGGMFLLANGRGCVLDETESLALCPFIVVADLQGKAVGARVVAAAEITESEIGELHRERIEQTRKLTYDSASDRVQAKSVRSLGAIRLATANEKVTDQDDPCGLLVEIVRRNGLDQLPWSAKAARLRERLGFLAEIDPQGWGDMRYEALIAELDEWLTPFAGLPLGLGDFEGKPLLEGLRYWLTLRGRTLEEVNRIAPDAFMTPAGNSRPIRYSGSQAMLAVRVQELYGLKQHPAILDGKHPLKLELLSPAGRPVQVTADLPGFWQGSWPAVRAEMRSRYPKHFWPEDAANAPATSRMRPGR